MPANSRWDLIRRLRVNHQGLWLLTVANEAVSELSGPQANKNQQKSNIIQKFSQEHHRRIFQRPGTRMLASTLPDEVEGKDYKTCRKWSCFKSFAKNHWQFKTIWESYPTFMFFPCRERQS